jgi:hypothetical protein
MAEVDLQIVREFFELHRFKVATRWPQHEAERDSDGGVQLYVQNTGAVAPAEDADVALHPSRIGQIANGLVEIRPWHTDRFYASLVESNPVLTEFADPGALGHAAEFFGGEPFATILVVSELPRTAEQRAQALRRISEAGVQHVIEFPAILEDLFERIALTGTYNGSPTLQLLQLLKRYRLLRSQQLEFTFPRESASYGRNPRVDTAAPPDDADA